MPVIRECIVTTIDAEGRPHVAPLGLHEAGSELVIAPFHPSTTLDNLRAVPRAIANYTDDVRVFAGCLTGRSGFALTTSGIDVPRLAGALAHGELEVVRVEEDEQRPRFFCRVLRGETHAPFTGFNRAKAAVIEAAILVSRLNMLSPDKIDREIGYLKIAIDKTAGPAELEAWAWLMEKVEAHRAART